MRSQKKMTERKVDSKVGLFTGSGKPTELKSGDRLVFSMKTGTFYLTRRGWLIKFGKRGSENNPTGLVVNKNTPKEVLVSQFIIFASNLAIVNSLRAKKEKVDTRRVVIRLV